MITAVLSRAAEQPVPQEAHARLNKDDMPFIRSRAPASAGARAPTLSSARWKLQIPQMIWCSTALIDRFVTGAGAGGTCTHMCPESLPPVPAVGIIRKALTPGTYEERQP